MIYKSTLIVLKFLTLSGMIGLCSHGWIYLITIIRYNQRLELIPALYLFLLFLCVFSFFSIPFIRSKYCRIPLVLLIVTNFFLEYSFFLITGSSLDVPLTETLWNERYALSEITGAFYLLPLLKAAALALGAALVLGWNPPPRFRIPSFLTIVPVITLVIVSRLSTYILTSPPPFSAVADLISVIESSKYNGPREGIAYTGALSPKIKNIVLIMDESVRGDYLSINNPELNTTPYLKGWTSDLFSFGEAVSAANCSAPSRYIVRTGLQPSQLPDINQRGLKSPSLWQYAKQAGYSTVYIDGYARFNNALLSNHSYMNMSEREAIDNSIPITTLPRYLRDSDIAHEVVKILMNSQKPTFIFAEKAGAHYPYHKLYPPAYAGSEGVFPTPNLDDPEQRKRSYRLVTQWSVDEFFKKLLPKVDLDNTIFIYTSDHGQNLLEADYAMTQCSTMGTIHPNEANVPLAVITRNQDLKTLFRSAAAEHFNRTSHFQLFPTLLWLMGYENEFVNRFGASLLSPPAQQRWGFFTGSVFSKQYRWVQG